jgi:hypothetical protein
LHEKLDDAKEEKTYLTREKELIKNLVTESRAEISKKRMADVSPAFENRKIKGTKHVKQRKTNKKQNS